MNLSESEIVRQAIDMFGEQSQIIVAIEELSELQKELCKLLRGHYHISNMSEEMADVEIMLEQLKLIFNNRDNIENWKQTKLLRLKLRTERFMGEKSPDVFPKPLENI